MTFALPPSLQLPDGAAAVAQLRHYYAPQEGPGAFYTGSRYDSWDSTGQRHHDQDTFTADDLVAVTFLSVKVPGRAAIELLDTQRSTFTALLVELGPDRDLVDVGEELGSGSAGWQLMSALRNLPDVGATTASKLLARKRPRLRPIYDSVVAEITGTQANLWEPLRVALRADHGSLHERLLRLRAAAGLPASLSALRVFDVIAWMDGKAQLTTIKTAAIEAARPGEPHEQEPDI